MAEGRVAVVVHNDVVRDARVRKEVSTLVSAGMSVDVFGLRTKKDRYPSRIENCHRLTLIRVKQPLRSNRLRKMVKRVVEGVLVLAALLLVTWVANTHSYPRHGIVPLLLIAPVVVLNSLSAARRGRLKPIYAALAAATAVALLWNDKMTVPEFVAGGMAYWAIFRFSPGLKGLKALAVRLMHHVFALVRPSILETRFRRLADLLFDEVSKEEYDIVHCHDVIALIAGGKLKRANPRITLIWDAHEIYEAMANSKSKRMMRRIIKENQKFVDRFITINTSIGDFYSSHYKLPEPHIIMNATRFDGPPRDDGRLRRAAGLDDETKILLFQGGLAAFRGLNALMEAARDLPDAWTIVVMGWGRMEHDLRALEAKLADRRRSFVLLPPAPQEELAQWTAGANLGIIPYENVGLNHLYCTPNKLWEYPNAGVPILATGLVEMEKMILDWDTGFLLPRDFSGSDIVDFLADITDEELSAKKGNCLAFSQSMSWAKYEPELLSVYASIVKPERVSLVS